MTVVVFTVPPGVRAGQQIVVQAPNGQRVTVQLPPNTLPGQRMQVSVPDSAQPSQQAPSPGAGTGGGNAGSSGMGSAPQHGTSLFEFVVSEYLPLLLGANQYGLRSGHCCSHDDRYLHMPNHTSD